MNFSIGSCAPVDAQILRHKIANRFQKNLETLFEIQKTRKKVTVLATISALGRRQMPYIRHKGD